MTCFSFIKINSKNLRPALAKPLGLHTDIFAMTCFSFIKINSKILRPALAKPLGLHTVQT